MRSLSFLSEGWGLAASGQQGSRSLGRMWRWLPLWLLLLVGSACAFSDAPPTGFNGDKPGIRLCQSNDDCLDGQSCFRQYCRTDEVLPDNQIVSLHLLPPPTHQYGDPNTFVTKQQFIGVDVSTLHQQGETKRYLKLREAYTVSGVLAQQDENGTRVAAKIRFLDKDYIPGHPIMIQIETDARGNFQTQLTHGDYEVEIIPLDSKYPPHIIPKLSIEKPTVGATAEEGKLFLNIPADDKYPHIKGRIIHKASASLKGAGLEGLTIQVFSSQNQIISSTVKTAADGTFSLWLSARDKPHTIRIQMNTQLGHPQIDIPYAPSRVGQGEHIDLGDIALGHLIEPIKISGKVEGASENGGGVLPGSRVHLLGEVYLKYLFRGQELKGFYRVDTIADKNGAFEAFVLPGSYTIEVLPPVASADQWSRVSIRKENMIHATATGGIQITLPPKPKIEGYVCQKEDRSCRTQVAATQVQAIWRGRLSQISANPQPDQQIPSTDSLQATSQGDGSFSLSLDPGVYDLIFVPPGDSGLARRLYSNLRVEAGAKPSTIYSYLPKAKHLIGTVIGPDGRPIPHTSVEMYSFSKDPSQTVYLLGRAKTNSLGEFSLAYQLPTVE